MPNIDCGLDIGSTNLKVVFVGDDGRVLYSRSIPTPRIQDPFGVVTDASELVQKLEDLIIEGWKQLGTNTPLRSIAAAGIGEDGVGVYDDLTPTGFAIPWFDCRAKDEARSLSRFARLQARTGIAIGPDRAASKWLWLHGHKSQELTDATYWIALTDYPSVWWSGTPFMSLSLAPRTACFDVRERQWIEELLTAVHAPNLPPLRGAGEIIGRVRQGRLRESGAASAETLIVAGGHDHPIAATTIKRFDPDARVDSMGTANLVYGETQTSSPWQTSDVLALSVPPAGGKGIACLGVVEFSAAMDKIQESAASFRAYLAHSRLPGSPASSIDDLARTDRDHLTLIRRGLETTSLQARHRFEAIDALGVPKGALYTTGGWSRSHAFVELRASIFGEPIHAIGDLELTAIGAALFGREAATGHSVCPIRPEDITTILPHASWKADYEELYQLFIRA